MIHLLATSIAPSSFFPYELFAGPESFGEVFTIVVIGLLVFAVIDLVWLGLVARTFYVREAGEVLLKKARTVPAIVFYVLYVTIVCFLAVIPVVYAAEGSDYWLRSFLIGASMGFFAYMTYDLTNLSVMKQWSIKLAIVDIVWGTFLTGSVAALTTVIASAILIP